MKFINGYRFGRIVDKCKTLPHPFFGRFKLITDFACDISSQNSYLKYIGTQLFYCIEFETGDLRKPFISAQFQIKGRTGTVCFGNRFAIDPERSPRSVFTVYDQSKVRLAQRDIFCGRKNYGTAESQQNEELLFHKSKIFGTPVVIFVGFHKTAIFGSN